MNGVGLRIAGVALNALGAIVLAVRVKRVLDVLVQAQAAADVNFRAVESVLSGRPGPPVPIIVGMDEHVEEQQRSGIRLLVVGFTLIAVGNSLIAAAFLLDS